MSYKIKFTKKFKKDIRLAIKQNKNLDKMYDVIDILAKNKKLDEKYRDHALLGDYIGARECHIEPDWLLIYEIIDEILVLVLHRIGSHSQLF